MQTLIEGAKALGLTLSRQQAAQFETYLRELLAANRRLGLTALREPEAIQRRHFLESLAVAVALAKLAIQPDRAIDIGSGGGFPGLPLKIVRPEVRLTLLEATGRKAAFLAELVQRLGLAQVEVATGRAEALAHDPAHRQAYDLALARAVAPLPVLVELALPFLRLGGYLAAPKGSRAPQEAEEAAKALAVCGGHLERIEPLAAPGARVAPTLVLVRKVSPTPEGYPRRPGIPFKRPLRL